MTQHPIEHPHQTREQRTRTVPRGVWRGLVVCALVVIVSVVWIVSNGAFSGSHPARTSAQTTEMDGMAGMNMSANGAITLTAGQLRQFGVTFGTVDVRPMTTDIRVPGVVAINERTVSQVTLKFGGYVERLYVNATGQSVRQGQPLLEIYSPDLVAAQQELLLSRQLQRDMG